MGKNGDRIVISADPCGDDVTASRADALATQLSLARVRDARTIEAAIVLAVTPNRLELRVLDEQRAVRNGAPPRGRPVVIDLARIDTKPGAGASLRQPLARAMGIKRGDTYRPRVLDATAGFGHDTWLLASLGCNVTAIERHAVVAAMLQDAVERARDVQPDVAARIDVKHDDTHRVLKRCLADSNSAVDVVYLDPMYPAGPRRAAQRKAMRVLRDLVGEDDDSTSLLDAARHVARKRVVVKRPIHAPPLAPGPVQSHKGNAVRFDVWVGESPKCPNTP